MKYFSTRSSNDPVSFEHAVMEGLAPDGGLYVPQSVPKLDPSFSEKWASKSFEELSFAIMRHYVGTEEIPDKDLTELIARSYSTFRSKEVTPVSPLDAKQGLFLLELFHGPTYAFKDVALQFLGNLFEYFLVRRNAGKADNAKDRETLTVVGATSGDTGSAAIYGLRNKKDVDVFILYPTGRISPIQEKQMTTVLDKNVHTISVPGTFDDCQNIVKELFGDKEFNTKHHVGAVNSINWARILAQMTYYFKAYFALPPSSRDGNTRPSFVVPSGNFGDILAGYYAREMGLPIDLVIATNENDILYRFLNSGSYSRGSEVLATPSPAMDILVSSNFERFLWHAAHHTVASHDALKAGKLVAEWMTDLKQKGSFAVPPEVLKYATSVFHAQRASNEDTYNAIQQTYLKIAPGRIVDPHTAVGVHGALLEPAGTRIVLATAHPAKFSSAVTKSLANQPNFDFDKQVMPTEFKEMMQAKEKKLPAENKNISTIKNMIEETLKL